MDTDFTKVYLNIINESKDKPKEEINDDGNGDFYKELAREIKAQKEEWSKDREKYIDKLLAGFRNLDMEGILALKDKAQDLLKTPNFIVKYGKVLEELNTDDMAFPYQAWSQLQLDFAEFMKRPNRAARKKMIEKCKKFFDNSNDEVLKKLSEAEDKLMKIFSEYAKKR